MSRARPFTRLLSRLTGRPSNTPRKERNQTRRLFLESLEDRRVLATIASTFDAGTGTLTLTGTDAAADTVNVSLAGATLTLGTTAGNTINLTSIGLLDAVGPQAVPLGGANVTRLVIDLRGSADTVNLSGVAATPLLTALEINDTGADAGADAVSASGTISIGGSLSVAGVEATTLSTNVTTVGAQLYGGPVTLGADVVLAGSTVTFNGTLAGGTNDLSITGNAVFGDAAADTVTGIGALSVSGTTTINTTTVTSAAAQTYDGNITLGADTALGATTVTFNGQVIGGGNDLGITGSAVFGNDAADTVTGVDALSVSGTTTINTNTVSTTGTQTYTGAATIGAAAATATLTTTDDAVLFGNSLTLSSNLTVNAGTGNITFTGAVNGGFALTANSTGTTRFAAAVGAGTPLASVTTNAGGATEINGATVTTAAGAQTYNDNVTLGASTTLTASTVTFNGTVVGNGNDLNITGGAVFGNEAADTVTGVAVLSVSGATTINTNTISSDGTQTYTGAATIGAAAAGATLTTTDDAVTFGNALTLNSALTVDAGAGNITFTGAVDGGFALTANSTGTTRFVAAVGAATPLASVTTNAGGTTEINGGEVDTAGGPQTYNDNVTLGADTQLTASTVTFNGTVVGNGNNLNITGGAVFGDAATDTVTAVDLLSVSGAATINTNTVSTTGTQTYSGNLEIGPTALVATLTTTNDSFVVGNVTRLHSDLTVIAGTGDITFAGATRGAFHLLLNSSGTTRFQASVGFPEPHSSLTTDAGGTTAIDGSSVHTATGPQTYNDNVVLGDTVGLIAGIATFNGMVVGNGNGLSVIGDVVFGNATTDTVTGLGLLIVNGAATINTNTVSTTSTQTYKGAVNIGATAGTATLSTTDNAVVFENTTTLNSNLIVNAGAGDITFTGTVSGGFALTANSTGTTQFQAAVGTPTALASLTTNAGGTTQINGGSVNTAAGPQTYNDNVSLGANTQLTAGTVTFNGTVTGNGNDLAITGNAVFGDAAADTVTGVDVLSVSGTTTINTNTVSTTGTQTYTGAATIGAPAGTATLSTTDDAVLFGNTLTLNSNLVVNAGSGSITFTGAVNGANSLSANSTGATIFSSTVGAGTALTSLTTNAGGTTQLNGGGSPTVRTTIAQTYNDPVTLGNHTVLIGGAGDITFNGTVNGAFDLTTTAGGTTTFGAAVGGSTALRNLDINPGGTTQLRANITTTQNQTYGNAAFAGNAATHLITLTGNNVTIENTGSVNGSAAGESVKIVAAGSIAIDGPVGNTQPLDILTLQAAVAATQSAAIRGSGLELLGTGNFTLNHADNDFAELAGSVGGTVSYNDATALTIGTVNATVGLSAATMTVTTGGPLTVATSATAGGSVQLTANEAAAVDTNNVTVNGTVSSAASSVTIRAGDHINIQGTVEAATTIDLLSIDGVDVPAAGAGGVTGTVFTLSGTLTAPQINVTGAAQNDVFDIEFALITGPVAVRGGGNDATLAPGFVRDTGAADVPAVTKNSKAPFFLPTLKTFVIGDQLLIDDNGATPLANFNRDYTIDGVQIRRFGDAGAFITFPDHDLELLKLTTGRGNNDVTVNLATGGALPEIVQIDTAGPQIGPDDDRFQILGTAGGDKISIGDINLHPSLNSPALGPLRAHFELNGFTRQWIQSLDGNDVIDNISSVPGLLDGGAGEDAINSVVNHASSFRLAKKVENSIPKNVTLVLGNEDADKLYVGAGAVDKNVAVTPLIAALRQFPDRGITFLLGDQFVNGSNKLQDVPLAKQKGDNYASSATAFQHGFVARRDFNDPAPAPNTSLGLFRFGAGDKVKFSKTIAWLKAQLFVGAAVPLLLKSFNTQVQEYVRPVTDAAGEAPLPIDFEEGASPLVIDARIDVNRDGNLTPLDALAVINDLNAHGIRTLPPSLLAEGEDETSYDENVDQEPTLDVNADGKLTALDALLVINVLNAFGPTADGVASEDSATDAFFEELAAEDIYTTSTGQPVLTSPASSTALTAEAILALLASDTSTAPRRR